MARWREMSRTPEENNANMSCCTWINASRMDQQAGVWIPGYLRDRLWGPSDNRQREGLGYVGVPLGYCSGTLAVSSRLSARPTRHFAVFRREYDVTPDCLPQKLPVLTNDFYLDTFFNPVWTSGPHVFALAGQGTVVRPESDAIEPCPGYDASHARHVVESISAPYYQVFSGGDPKPWKNVAITEQDDAEFVAFQERMRVGALGLDARAGAHIYLATQAPWVVRVWFSREGFEWYTCWRFRILGFARSDPVRLQ
ncbi:hypothetical protein EV363DRAFT_1419259 [Boletus edulis]|nr:hypothetical protein EV363DRAFT_1419259 [Boletus edulis]